MYTRECRPKVGPVDSSNRVRLSTASSQAKWNMQRCKNVVHNNKISATKWYVFHQYISGPSRRTLSMTIFILLSLETVALRQSKICICKYMKRNRRRLQAKGMAITFHLAEVCGIFLFAIRFDRRVVNWFHTSTSTTHRYNVYFVRAGGAIKSATRHRWIRCSWYYSICLM